MIRVMATFLFVLLWPLVAPAQSAATSLSLEDTSWRLIHLPEGEDVSDLGKGAPTVTFSDGRVHGFSGCNQFMGAYTREGDTLVLGQMAGTMMACADPRIESLERQFLAALSGRLVVSITDAGLQLAPEGGGAPLQFKPAAAPRLEGVAWEVAGFNNGRQAVASPILGSSITLKFEDGTVSGSAGCNRFTGGYEASDESLSIKPLATTRMACDAKLMEQEQRFLAALQSATTWSVVRGMLDVHRADGERVLMANPIERPQAY
jgi:heat shock protein HslJ